MSTATLAVETEAPRPRRGSRALAQFVRVFCRDRQAVLGLVIIAITGGAALAAPLISPWDPLSSAGVERLAPIGTPGHMLGTDEQGRDILSRLIWGGRASLMVGILPTVTAGLVALFLGLLAGDLGGLVDHVIMRALDVFFTEVKDRNSVMAPLILCEQQSRLDVIVKVHGGGYTGQAGAIMQGLARALKIMFGKAEGVDARSD